MLSTVDLADPRGARCLGLVLQYQEVSIAYSRYQVLMPFQHMVRWSFIHDCTERQEIILCSCENAIDSRIRIINSFLRF